MVDILEILRQAIAIGITVGGTTGALLGSIRLIDLLLPEEEPERPEEPEVTLPPEEEIPEEEEVEEIEILPTPVITPPISISAFRMSSAFGG